MILTCNEEVGEKDPPKETQKWEEKKHEKKLGKDSWIESWKDWRRVGQSLLKPGVCFAAQLQHGMQLSIPTNIEIRKEHGRNMFMLI